MAVTTNGPAPVPVRLERYSSQLWLLACISYGVGDTLTTVIGITTGLAVEGSPFMAAVLHEGGTPGVVVAKLAIFAGFYALWRSISSPGRVGVPLALVLVGTVVTVWNAFVLLS